MPIKLDFTKILEKNLIPLVISFLVALVFYLTKFHKEWEWPTVIGCALFLFIRLSMWIYSFVEKKREDRQDEKVRNCRAQLNDNILRQNALVFFHNCQEVAVALYNHPKHQGEYGNERYVSFGEQPGFPFVMSVNDYSLDPINEKYGFLYCDNEFACYNGGTRHIVFHPVFYELVKKYVETGVISF